MIMNSGPVKAILPGGRLHLQHGPIDLIIKADGHADAVQMAYKIAEERFQTILSELVSELPLLRQPSSTISKPATPVAQRMWQATCSFPDTFITPMAAVAGSVADDILAVMVEGSPGLTKVFVNNGGDIALWKNSSEEFSIALVPQPVLQRYSETQPITVRIRADDQIGGVATSGWQGRSLSLGIADSVTVLAKNAAIADASTTLIANAVNIDSDKVRRQSAREIDMDSDLGEQLITVDVGQLDEKERRAALGNGLRRAAEFFSMNILTSAFLYLQGQHVTLPDASVIQ